MRKDTQWWMTDNMEWHVQTIEIDRHGGMTDNWKWYIKWEMLENGRMSDNGRLQIIEIDR